jgi:hypothetical protein
MSKAVPILGGIALERVRRLVHAFDTDKVNGGFGNVKNGTT